MSGIVTAVLVTMDATCLTCGEADGGALADADHTMTSSATFLVIGPMALFANTRTFSAGTYSLNDGAIGR